MKFWFYKKSNEKKTNCKNKNQIKRKDKFNGYYEIYEILEGWHKKKEKKKKKSQLKPNWMTYIKLAA
jgi:adenylosuccinate synthase